MLVLSSQAITFIKIVLISALMTWFVILIEKHIRNEWLRMFLKFGVLLLVFGFGLQYVAQVDF